MFPVNHLSFFGRIEQVSNFAAHYFFGFFHERGEVGFVEIAHKNKVYHRTVHAFGKIANEVDPLHIPQSVNDVLDDLVETEVLQNYVVDFPKKRVAGVGAEDFFVALAARKQQPGIF